MQTKHVSNCPSCNKKTWSDGLRHYNSSNSYNDYHLCAIKVNKTRPIKAAAGYANINHSDSFAALGSDSLILSATCKDCGCCVADETLHNRWHEDMVTKEFEMLREELSNLVRERLLKEDDT